MVSHEFTLSTRDLTSMTLSLYRPSGFLKNDEQIMSCFKTAPKSQSLIEQWRTKTEKSGMRHTIYSLNGDQYKGQWKNNKKHGYGTQIWKKRGAMYEGWWKRGKPDGCGIYSVFLPEINEYTKQYDGAWKDGKKHGHGRHFYTDSDVYEGEWRRGQRCGIGQMWYSNGDYYEGQWLNDTCHGQGTLRHANGNWYDGNWKDGKKHGAGKFFYKEKCQLYEGTWVNGTPKHGSITELEDNETPSPRKYEVKEDLQHPDNVDPDETVSDIEDNEATAVATYNLTENYPNLPNFEGFGRGSKFGQSETLAPGMCEESDTLPNPSDIDPQPSTSTQDLPPASLEETPMDQVAEETEEE